MWRRGLQRGSWDPLFSRDCYANIGVLARATVVADDPLGRPAVTCDSASRGTYFTAHKALRSGMTFSDKGWVRIIDAQSFQKTMTGAALASQGPEVSVNGFRARRFT